MFWLLLCFGCCFRDLMTEECDLELVLTRAFLEVDKALAEHLHISSNGRLFYWEVDTTILSMQCVMYF